MRGLVSHIVKLHYSFKNLLLSFWERIRQIKCIVMITKEGSTKTVNFLTPSAELDVIGRCHVRYIGEYAISSTLWIYTIFIVIVLSDYNAAFLCHCWFLFILIWACCYANRTPTDKVSDTKVTVKARGPLVSCIQHFLSVLVFWQLIHMWIPLNSAGSLACHTYCDTRHPFIMIIFEDTWHSHLMLSV